MNVEMIIYDLLFLILFLLSVPFLAIRRKLYRGYWQRLGFISHLKKSQGCIWLHAVSVGEIISAQRLIKDLRKEFPQKDFLISTVTASGNKIAQAIAGPKDCVTYLPLDISFIIKRFIERFRPCIFIAMETEIWPNLFIQLQRASVPKVILNGRISERAFGKYNFFKKFFKPVLEKVDCFAMQSDRDSARILELGAVGEKVTVTGNMKFDSESNGEQAMSIGQLRERLGLGPDATLLVGGCTHRGEEEILFLVFKRLREIKSTLRLLIAPRHIERIKEIERLGKQYGLSTVRISQLSGGSLDSNCVFLLDVLGQLKDYYAVSTITFVGGSLVPWGGHNILEPANFAKPIIFGKYMQNFSDIRDLFLKNEAAIEVGSVEELEESLKELLIDSSQAKNLGLRARAVVDNNKGATSRNVEIIKKLLSSHERLPI